MGFGTEFRDLATASSSSVHLLVPENHISTGAPGQGITLLPCTPLKARKLLFCGKGVPPPSIWLFH